MRSAKKNVAENPQLQKRNTNHKKSFPSKVNILGIDYTINYSDNNIDINSMSYDAHLGLINYMTRNINVYTKHQPEGAVWQVLWHEILHALVDSLGIEALQSQEDEKENKKNHAQLDLLATGISDVLLRNGWLK